MIHYQEEDFAKMERRYRADLLNKISGIKPVNLLGTADQRRNTNLAIFNSVLHIGANPPLLGILFRPLTVDRHSYENIKSTGCFTLNQVHTGNYKQAHQTSAKYEKEVSEFDATGLVPIWEEGFAAPFVEGSQIRIGLEWEDEQHIKANDTILVIGRIKHLLLPEEAIAKNGEIDHEAIETVGVAGLNSYYRLHHLDQLEYARPE